MQHVTDAFDGAAGDGQVREVAFDELDGLDVAQIPPLAGAQIVDDADTLSAPVKLLDEVRSDESCSTSNQ